MQLRDSIERRTQEFFDQITPDDAEVIYDQLKEYETSQEYQLGYLEGQLDVFNSLQRNPLKKDVTNDKQFKTFITEQNNKIDKLAKEYDKEVPEKNKKELEYTRTRTSYWWGYLNAEIDFESKLGSIDHKRFR